MHDPCCIAYLIDPQCIKTKSMYSEIELRSEKCYGRTICDYFDTTGLKPNTEVAVELAREKFWNIVEDCIRLYP